MATTKSKVSKSDTTPTKSNTKKVENVVTESSEATITEAKKYKVKRDFDPNTIVTVKNGTQGVLVYKSKRTGEKFVWSSFGEEQDMDLQELKNAKNNSKTFFINNWFLIDDIEVLEHLGVSQYYKYALNFNAFDSLFTEEPNVIKDTISKLSNGQRKSVVYRAKQLISDGEIDSIKVINALEDSLSVELIDREK